MFSPFVKVSLHKIFTLYISCVLSLEMWNLAFYFSICPYRHFLFQYYIKTPFNITLLRFFFFCVCLFIFCYVVILFLRARVWARGWEWEGLEGQNPQIDYWLYFSSRKGQNKRRLGKMTRNMAECIFSPTNFIIGEKFQHNRHQLLHLWWWLTFSRREPRVLLLTYTDTCCQMDGATFLNHTSSKRTSDFSALGEIKWIGRDKILPMALNCEKGLVLAFSLHYRECFGCEWRDLWVSGRTSCHFIVSSDAARTRSPERTSVPICYARPPHPSTAASSSWSWLSFCKTSSSVFSKDSAVELVVFYTWPLHLLPLQFVSSSSTSQNPVWCFFALVSINIDFIVLWMPALKHDLERWRGSSGLDYLLAAGIVRSLVSFFIEMLIYWLLTYVNKLRVTTIWIPNRTFVFQ